jgi:hypothetical protein
MTRLTRRLVFAVTSLFVALALPAGTAFAMPAPTVPDTGAANSAPVIIDRVTTTSSIALWQLALVALTAAITAAVAVAVATRLTGANRRSHAQPA